MFNKMLGEITGFVAGRGDEGRNLQCYNNNATSRTWPIESWQLIIMLTLMVLYAIDYTN